MSAKKENKTKQDKVPGIKTSELRSMIEEKLKKNHKVFSDVYGAEQTEAIFKALTEAYLEDRDNSKVLNTANRAFFDRIPSDAAQQVAQHFNIRTHGSLNAPDAKSIVKNNVASSASPTPVAAEAQSAVADAVQHGSSSGSEAMVDPQESAL